VRSEEEIKALYKELDEAVKIVDEKPEIVDDRDFQYLCNVQDALDWVLGEISTEGFRSGNYLKLERFGQLVPKTKVKPQLRPCAWKDCKEQCDINKLPASWELVLTRHLKLGLLCPLHWKELRNLLETRLK